MSSRNSILYSRWDGRSWMEPLDVLYVPGDAIADFVAATVGPDNRLHVLWTGQSSIYYSSAPSRLADSAHAWTTPIAVATGGARTSWESDIAADPLGSLHIVYATRGTDVGVYHIRSQDGGLTWELPVRLSEPFSRLETSFLNVRVLADSASGLHALWQTNQGDGFGQAVYYARSKDDGQSWSASAQLGYRDPGDFGAAYPYLAAVTDSEVHLIYLDGTNRGRSQRISRDGGETWSDPALIIAEMEGVNGYVQPVVDGVGQMHLIINMRTRAEQVVGIYYSRWQGDGWSPVVPVDVSSPAASSAHYAAATVRLGNEIHVVYNDIEAGEIWHVRGLLANVNPLPAQALVPAQTALPVAPTLAPAEATLMPGATQKPQIQTPSPPTSSSIGSALMLSAGAALLLVVGVLVWIRVRAR